MGPPSEWLVTNIPEVRVGNQDSERGRVINIVFIKMRVFQGIESVGEV